MKIHILFGVFVVLCYVNSIESTIPGLNLGGGGGGSSGIAGLLGGLLGGGGSGGSSGSGNLLRTLIQGLAGRPGVEGDGAPDIEESGSSDAVGDALSGLIGTKLRLVNYARGRTNARYDSYQSLLDRIGLALPVFTSALSGGAGGSNIGNGASNTDDGNAEIPLDYGPSDSGSFNGNTDSGSIVENTGASGTGAGSLNVGNNYATGLTTGNGGNGGGSIIVDDGNTGGFNGGFSNGNSFAGTGSGSLNVGNNYGIDSSGAGNGQFRPSPVDPYAGAGQVEPAAIYGPPGYVPPPVVDHTSDISENDVRIDVDTSQRAGGVGGGRALSNGVQLQRVGGSRVSQSSGGGIISTNNYNRNSIVTQTAKTSSNGLNTRSGSNGGARLNSIESSNGGSIRSSGTNGGSTGSRSSGTNGGSSQVSDALSNFVSILLRIPARAINTSRTRTNTYYDRIESTLNQLNTIGPVLLRSFSGGSRSGGATPLASTDNGSNGGGGDALQFSPDVS